MIPLVLLLADSEQEQEEGVKSNEGLLDWRAGQRVEGRHSCGGAPREVGKDPEKSNPEKWGNTK